jgi:hypothetical protein
MAMVANLLDKKKKSPALRSRSLFMLPREQIWSKPESSPNHFFELFNKSTLKVIRSESTGKQEMAPSPKHKQLAKVALRRRYHHERAIPVQRLVSGIPFVLFEWQSNYATVEIAADVSVQG